MKAPDFEPLGVAPEQVPHHVAIIMDGNGRWARARGLPRIAGHRAGTEAFRAVVRAAIEFGVRHLTMFAFSTENWKRPQSEVRGLFQLLESVIERHLDELDANGIRLRHIGWLDGVPAHLAEAIRRAIERTQGNDRLMVNVAFNYGGRAEIVRAVQRIIRDGRAAEEIDEALVASYLETAGIPDPDLVIRTAGEMRLSNFLLWQSAYAEIYSTPTLWPDFGREDLAAAIRDYARRERRFGSLPGTGDEQTLPAAQAEPHERPVAAAESPIDDSTCEPV